MDYGWASMKVSFIASRASYEFLQTELAALKTTLTGQRCGWHEQLWKDRLRWRKLTERKWADGSTSNWIIAYSDKVSACLQMDYTQLHWDTSTWLISWLAHRNIMTSARRQHKTMFGELISGVFVGVIPWTVVYCGKAHLCSFFFF